MNNQQPSTQRSKVWLRRILLSLVLIEPIILCVAMQPDIIEVPFLLAALYLPIAIAAAIIMAIRAVKRKADPQPVQDSAAMKPAPSDITFPVKDVIRKPLARLEYWNKWQILHSYPSEHDSFSFLEINCLTGELRRHTTISRSQDEPHHVYDSCTEQDVLRCGDETLKDFTADNWQAYVKPPRPVSLRSPLTVSAAECRPGKTTDVDAYFMLHSHQVDAYYFESSTIYLRRCDTGWRLFLLQCGDRLDGRLARMKMTDESYLRHLAETQFHTFDRLLTAEETAYVMNLLPAQHDGAEGLLDDWKTVRGQWGPTSACYWKDGFCVDCVQLPHIPMLFEKLAEVAERGLTVAEAP